MNMKLGKVAGYPANRSTCTFFSVYIPPKKIAIMVKKTWDITFFLFLCLRGSEFPHMPLNTSGPVVFVCVCTAKLTCGNSTSQFGAHGTNSLPAVLNDAECAVNTNLKREKTDIKSYKDENKTCTLTGNMLDMEKLKHHVFIIKRLKKIVYTLTAM